MQIFVFALSVFVAIALLLWRTQIIVLWNNWRWSKLVPEHAENPYYRDFIEQSPDAFFVVEVMHAGNFRFIELNPVAVKCFDPQGIGFVSRNLDELLHHAIDQNHRGILQELESQLLKVVMTGEPVQYEEKLGIIGNSDSSIYGIKLSPVASDTGNRRIMCFARDTDKYGNFKQERLKRTKLEEQFSDFSANVPGFLFSYVQKPNGAASMPFASAGIQALFGLWPEDVVQSLAPLNMLIHPDSKPQIIESIARSAADLLPLEAEFCVEHPVKGELWIESRAAPILNNDGSIVWHGFMYDITPRKLMDEAVRNSLKNYTEAQRLGKMGSWELNTASGTLNWSDEIYRILEADPSRYDASYEILLNAVHPDDREAVIKAYRAIRDRNMSCSIDYRCSFQDGRIKYIHECVEARYEADMKSRYVHGIVQDMSSVRASDRHLKDTQDRLRELVISREMLREEERKHLAWELHEELGQLLAAMKMRMSSLRSQLKGNHIDQVNDIRSVIELIDNSIRTVHDIVSELRPTVLFHGVVAALEWLIAEYNKHPGIECKLEIDEEDNILLNEEMTTLVFRTAQEAMEGAMRQTNVTRMSISWTSNKDHLRLALQHDGVAHSAEYPTEKSLVIFGMQERIAAFGGVMQVFSTLDHDTVIEACFLNRDY